MCVIDTGAVVRLNHECAVPWNGPRRERKKFEVFAMESNMLTLGLLQNLNAWEIILILALGLLLFGRKLPEVGRSLGRGIVEFKKGLKGVEEEVHAASMPQNQPPAYRPPLQSGGADVRVSRADGAEATPAKPSEPAN